MSRSPLIIDAHLLVLYVVGSYDRGLVATHKRCEEFDDIDFDILLFLIGQYTEVLLSPHTLAETSNLVRLVGDPIKTQLTNHLSKLVQGSKESFFRSALAAANVAHGRLGLVDCVLLSGRKDATLLTKDFDLYRAALAQERKVINFTHYRERVSPRM